jgi:hypothetical protein
VLGRFEGAQGEVQSLGDFFTDPGVDPKAALEIDRIIRNKAMLRYAEEECEKDLYINMRLTWLEAENVFQVPRTLKRAHEIGIPPHACSLAVLGQTDFFHRAHGHARKSHDHRPRQPGVAALFSVPLCFGQNGAEK